MILAAACGMHSQTKNSSEPVPAFEGASVKAIHTGDRSIGTFPTPGHLVVKNHALTKTLVKAAYRLKEYKVSGAGGWMDSDAYDIDAKAAGNTNFMQDLTMLQALLVERFHLKFRNETRVFLSTG